MCEIPYVCRSTEAAIQSFRSNPKDVEGLSKKMVRCYGGVLVVALNVVVFGELVMSALLCLPSLINQKLSKFGNLQRDI